MASSSGSSSGGGGGGGSGSGSGGGNKQQQQQQHQQKKSSKNRFKKSFKTVLDSSLNYQWPLLSADQTIELLMLLKDRVVPSMTTAATTENMDTTSNTDDQSKESAAKKKKKKSKKSKKADENPLGEFVMNGFYLGINEVTKAMEENKAKLVVACKDVAPVIIQHLPVLAFLQKVPFCAIQTTNQTTPIRLGEIFGLKRVIAFAVSADGEAKCQELIQFVKKNAATLSIPWLTSKSISYRPLKLNEVGPKRLPRAGAKNSITPVPTPTTTTTTSSSSCSSTSTTPS